MNNNLSIIHAHNIGIANLKLNKPCSDFSHSIKVNDKITIATISDGASSATHSHIGAKANCIYAEIITKQKLKHFINNNITPNNTQWNIIANDIISETANLIANFSVVNNIPLQNLKATLLVVVFTPNGILTANIGDARLAYYIDDKWTSIGKPQKGQFYNQTNMLVNTASPDTFIINNFKQFIAITDGCEKSIWLSGNFVNNTYEDVNIPFEYITNKLINYLKFSSEPNQELKNILIDAPIFQNITDDKTILIAYHND